MKKLTTILAILMLGSFLVVGSASASLIPYWSLTHFDNSGEYGTSGATIKLDISSNDNADFGFFKFGEFGERVRVFTASDDQGATATAQFALQTDNTWDLTVWDDDSSAWGPTAEDFGLTFGFYFYRNSRLIFSDSTGDENPGLNTMEASYVNPAPNVDYADISLLFDGSEIINIKVDDVKPIPEPATMLLLGTGLLGLAVIGRRKFKK